MNVIPIYFNNATFYASYTHDENSVNLARYIYKTPQGTNETIKA